MQNRRPAQYIKNWDDCQACPLAKSRKNVVHYRGDIPADILFVGEAPGKSEDISGFPFDGPAGDQLDDILEIAFIHHTPRYCIANTIGCIPIRWNEFSPGKVRRDGVRQPSSEELDACHPRLTELIEICNPQRIIAVGSVADSLLRKKKIVPHAAIKHPAAILRESERTQYESIKRAALQIRKEVESLHV